VNDKENETCGRLGEDQTSRRRLSEGLFYAD
jgi:hypothetical protein